MKNENSKDLTKKADSEKILHHKEFTIALNRKYDEYKRSLALMVYKFFNKKASGGAFTNENMSN